MVDLNWILFWKLLNEGGILLISCAVNDLVVGSAHNHLRAPARQLIDIDNDYWGASGD